MLREYNINLSDSTVRLINSIQQPSIEKYIDYKIKSQESIWVTNYNNIKADTWPKCNSYKDFELLPDSIKKECIDFYNLSPKTFKNSIIKDSNKYLQTDNIFKVSKKLISVLTDNLNLIRGKKIIDLACNFGYYSIFAHQHQSLDIIGLDVREENITIANAIRQDLRINEQKLKFVQEDIHNCNYIQTLCNDRDTAFLFGIVYYLHNHYDILKAVCQSNIKHIIISMVESNEIMNVDQPLIWWRYEPTFSLKLGFNDKTEHVLVGYPNKVWIDLILKEFGFNRIFSDKEETFERTKSFLIYER
jgi:2-polyprenyl-3-methyl-5-hydroxy-6-metoxy-1,4-benzoquinol methylase